MEDGEVVVEVNTTKEVLKPTINEEHNQKHKWIVDNVNNTCK